MPMYAILSDADGKPCVIQNFREADSPAQAFSKMVYSHAKHGFLSRDDAPWHVLELPEEVWNCVHIKDSVYRYVDGDRESTTFDVDGMTAIK